MLNHYCSVSLKSVVIPDCLCRESSVFTLPEVARFPTQAFGDDDLNYYLLLFCFSNFHIVDKKIKRCVTHNDINSYSTFLTGQ